MDKVYFRWDIRFHLTDKETSDKVQRLCEKVPTAKLIKFGITKLDVVEAVFHVPINDFETFRDAANDVSFVYGDYRRLSQI